MNTQVQAFAPVPIPEIPAIDLQLNGIHLIEASAGTGKTWTLSALMVRLIVEGEFLTRQIIATTFTRAAAAELKIRIRSRFEQCRSLFHEAILNRADTLSRVHAEQDWLAVYLVQKLDVDELIHAKNRLQLALDSFDELFVGTLDSFCQKLLNEFAFDSGQHEILQITEQEAELCYQLMHDALRQWRSQQPARLIELLVMADQLKEVEDYRGSIETVLNFLAAQVQPEPMPQLDWASFDELYQQLKQIDDELLAPFNDFFAEDGTYYNNLNGIKCFKKHGALLMPMLNSIASNDLSYLLKLNEHKKYADLLEGFLAIESMFNKKPADQDALQQFLKIPVVAFIQQLARQREQLIAAIEQIDRHLRYFLSQHMRSELPRLLSERGETTFAQQMRVLASVLQQDEQHTLARHIQHRYPVALVDEFQDTNADQDCVIAHIWRQAVAAKPDNALRNPRPLEQSSRLLAARCASGQSNALLFPRSLGQSSALLNPRSCLVLVGDPKQAIYGFRGGDMLTYQRAKTEVMQLGGQQHFLKFNQRSIAPLVAAVDRLFSFTLELGENVYYQPVQAGGRNTAELHDGPNINHRPLRLLCVEEQKTEFEQVAWQIIQLLKTSQQGQVFLKNNSTQETITPNHIAVLCRSNSQLDKVQAALQRANVPVWRGSRVSIFQSPLAEDLVAVLQTMLAPYHEGRLRRALSGLMMGKTLSDLIELDQNPDELASLQGLFFTLGERWYKAGFLAAWQQLSEHFDIWQQLSRQPHAERLVVNLRHLLEIIHQQSEKIQGQHHLLAWLMRQISQPQQREWELERRLSGEQGVQLMTIHKSKGLEFPIVFVAGLDKSNRASPSKIIFYEQDQQRMLAFSDRDAVQLQAHQEREQAELRRLIYVALTRASVRLYVVAPPPVDDKGKIKGALYHWLPPARDGWADDNTAVQDGLSECPQFFYKQVDTSVDIQARPLPNHQVYAWGLTSFSQLSRHQRRTSVLPEDVPAADTLMHDDEHDGKSGAAIPVALIQAQTEAEPALLPLCFRFPRGANAGDCLHHILEQLNPAYPEQWPRIFEKKLQNFAIYAQLERYKQAPVEMEQMVDWFNHILHARLPDEATLAGLTTQIHEFEFHLAVSTQRMPVQAIHALLQQYQVPVAPLNPVFHARYLHGFIDLVYEHQGRFYIADYKSNYLGDEFDCYQENALRDNMSQSGYWLQAILYQVALHRYLKVRLPDYQSEQHLGGAVYLYLRGMQASSSQTGILHWQADIELIEQLDQLLGQH
ncbi:UvrD-helicase domain-containing protein [Alkanindiges sp. WGS2144]|uniref:UvrD-helicase domain-containing protein n=1 Tax=Alkanindiges sp. WGS2144 TaxID=3366808 RepID=UPI0037522631